MSRSCFEFVPHHVSPVRLGPMSTQLDKTAQVDFYGSLSHICYPADCANHGCETKPKCFEENEQF